MFQDVSVTRNFLSERWNCSLRKIDRLHQRGLLPWVDLTTGHGKRPTPRFRWSDVINYEEKNLMDITTKRENNNE